MAKLVHAKLTGELKVIENEDKSLTITIDGHNVIEVLLQLEGQGEVYFDAVAYQESEEEAKPDAQRAPDPDFIKKLMGDDGRAN